MHTKSIHQVMLLLIFQSITRVATSDVGMQTNAKPQRFLLWQFLLCVVREQVKLTL